MFLIDMFNKKTVMPAPEAALPGRDEPIPTAKTHFVNGRALKGPYPAGLKQAANSNDSAAADTPADVAAVEATEGQEG